MSDTAIVIIGIVIVFLLWKAMTFKSKAEAEADRRLDESLSDELIYDPVTGAKITLEQAESGHWIAHDNIDRVKDSDEIDQFYQGKAKILEQLKNHLREIGYRALEAESEFPENTEMFAHYDKWALSECYQSENAKWRVLFPTVTFKGTRQKPATTDTQLLFWLVDEGLSGHYYLREKTSFKALSDRFRNDDDIKLDRYECFTIAPSQNMLKVIKTVQAFGEEPGLAMEITDENLLIKTLQFPSMEDFLRIEKIAKSVAGSP